MGTPGRLDPIREAPLSFYQLIGITFASCRWLDGVHPVPSAFRLRVARAAIEQSRPIATVAPALLGDQDFYVDCGGISCLFLKSARLTVPDGSFLGPLRNEM